MTGSRSGSGHAELPRVGDYEVLEAIGRGATGTVFRARGITTGEVVALKMLHGGVSDEAVERFTREVAVAEQLRHRHIVTMLDTGLEEGVPYLVMELLRGQSLAAVIRAHPEGMEVTRAVDLVAQLSLGLHHAHQQGLVHRDVKPANVFVTHDAVVKVLDFGVAKLTDSTMTADGSLVGTLGYMAPEQLRGRAEIDGRADVFSAGVILYELLTGRRPFDADSSAAVLARILNEPPAALPAALPSARRLQSLLDRALAKDPGRRFPTAQALAHALWTVQFDGRAGTDASPADEEIDSAPEPDVTMASTPGIRAAVAVADDDHSVRSAPVPRWMYWAAALIGVSLAGVGLALWGL